MDLPDTKLNEMVQPQAHHRSVASPFFPSLSGIPFLPLLCMFLTISQMESNEHRYGRACISALGFFLFLFLKMKLKTIYNSWF